MDKIPIALQLYSLRDLAAQDFLKALEIAAELGYEGVEFAGYGGLESETLAGYLLELGLVPVSSHVSFQELSENLEAVSEYNLDLGNYTLVCPAPPRGFVPSRSNWRKLARDLAALGRRLAERGMRLGYHNHSFEFQKFDGVSGLDILYNEADPRYLQAQIDLGWVLHGGEDPLQYLRKFKGRCPLVHVKDFDENKKQTDVGCGLLDLPGVLEAAEEVGVEWLILETEEYQISPLKSVEVGLANLKAAQE